MTNVPNVNKGVAVISLVLNILIPGFGTLVASCCDANGNISKV